MPHLVTFLESLHQRVTSLEAASPPPSTAVELMTKDPSLRSLFIRFNHYDPHTDTASGFAMYHSLASLFTVRFNSSTGLFVVESKTPELNFSSSDVNKVYDFLRLRFDDESLSNE